MSLLAAFTAHELTTQLRSARFRVLAVAYVLVGVLPAVAMYLGSKTAGYLTDPGAYAKALGALLPSLTALFATILSVDAINREREEGSFAVVSLAPLSASGYLFRRWLAILAIAVPLTMLPSLIAAALATHAARRVPDVTPLAWEWLLHIAPPLLVMSALMLALGTITGRTLLAILAYGAAMTFGLGFLQDLLAMAHRHLEGPGDMIGFDPMVLSRLMWAVRGWWQFDTPTAAGYPVEVTADRFVPEAAMIVACTIFFLGVAPAFLRRTRPDVKPWRIRDDHPLRTILRGINRIRENYSADASLQPADRIVFAFALIASIACFALLLRRETRFMSLAAERYSAEVATDPREMSLSLVPRAISVEGETGRTIRTRTTFTIENRGEQPEQHLGFALHPGLAIERVTASCANARLTRRWERVGIDLDQAIAPRGTCNVTFDVRGTPDAIVFRLQGRGRFGHRYQTWLKGTKSIELSDLSRSTFIPAATRQRLLLTAGDFAPVPRYTPWHVDGAEIDSGRDTSSFVPETIAPASDIRLALRVPDGMTAADSCGTVAARQLASRCTLGFADLRITAAPFTPFPLNGKATLVHLTPHADLARIHAPAIAEGLALAESSWPGLKLSGAPVFVERPINGDGYRSNWFYARTNPIEASGSMYAIPEWLFIRRQPLGAQALAASIVASTLRARRDVLPEQQRFFAAFFETVASSRAGAGETRTATVGGKGPRPLTDPLLEGGWRDVTNARMRGVLVDLEYRVGADRLVEAVNEFAARPGTGNAKELVDLIGRRAGVDLHNVYRDFFAGTALPKLTIEDATFVRDGKRWVVRGFAHNLAVGESLVPIVLRTQFGSVRTTVKVGAGERVPFTLATDHEPRTLQLDPERVVYRHAAIGTVDSIDFRGES